MKTRYYFHGDELEDHPGQYYCAYCDLFVSQNHFSETMHSGSDKERYDRSVDDWKVIKNDSGGRFHHPNSVSNLFSSLPNLKQPKTGPFYRWLLKQKNRDDSIGDLSNDVRQDKAFPQKTSSIVKLRNYLIGQSACDAAVQALEKAHKEFKTKNF